LGVTEEQKLQILGRHIRRLRQDRDLSQEALADAANINRNHIGAIERGATKVGVDKLFRLADALGVTPAGLFEPFENR
jgi:transcriptional regulator with XRE-family HTH domain